jgi:hypothetical protein
MMFFGDPMVANVRSYICFSLVVLIISHSQVVVDYFPNLRTIQFKIFPLEMNENPSQVCPILLCEDLADSLVL